MSDEIKNMKEALMAGDDKFDVEKFKEALTKQLKEKKCLINACNNKCDPGYPPYQINTFVDSINVTIEKFIFRFGSKVNFDIGMCIDRLDVIIAEKIYNNSIVVKENSDFLDTMCQSISVPNGKNTWIMNQAIYDKIGQDPVISNGNVVITPLGQDLYTNGEITWYSPAMGESISDCISDCRDRIVHHGSRQNTVMYGNLDGVCILTSADIPSQIARSMKYDMDNDMFIFHVRLGIGVLPECFVRGEIVV